MFDCLSELQEAWATDLMMGNFFCVTCPYLFDLDTVAYFPLKRGMHSFDAVMRIRQTTHLLLELYQNGEEFYIYDRLKCGTGIPEPCSSHTSMRKKRISSCPS